MPSKVNPEDICTVKFALIHQKFIKKWHSDEDGWAGYELVGSDLHSRKQQIFQENNTFLFKSIIATIALT